MPTDYRSLYDKDYIGAWDLADGDKTITITKVIGGSLTGVGGRKSKKPVVYFQGSEKGFALNSTNGKTIAAMYGNFVEKWAGKKITLFKSSTRNPDGSGDVDCIRVRPQVRADAGAFTSDAGGGDEKLTEDQAKEIERGLDLAGSVTAAKFRGLMAKNSWATIADIPQSQFDSARGFINTEIDKQTARQQQPGEHHPEA